MSNGSPHPPNQINPSVFPPCACLHSPPTWKTPFSSLCISCSGFLSNSFHQSSPPLVHFGTHSLTQASTSPPQLSSHFSLTLSTSHSSSCPHSSLIHSSTQGLALLS